MTDATPRRTTGGPVLQDDVTEGIAAAFFAELAEVGYGRLSLEAVARRAGSGKAAIYRRWPSKEAMAVALVTDVAVAAIDIPDTGELRGDVRQFLVNACTVLDHPLPRAIVPDLVAEGTRNPELGEALLGAVRDPRRAKAAVLLARAVDRGELGPDTDVGMGLDLLAGPLYWHMVVVGTPTDDRYFDRLTDQVIAALKA